MLIKVSFIAFTPDVKVINNGQVLITPGTLFIGLRPDLLIADGF